MRDWFDAPIVKRSRYCYLSGGTQQSDQRSTTTSSSNQGLLEPQKSELSTFAGPASQQFGQYVQGQITNPSYALNLPRLNANGVFPQQQGAVNQMLTQGVSDASSNLAQRGFLNQNASPLAAGLGTQNVAAQLLPQIGQNVQAQQTFPFTAQQAQIQNVANTFQQLIALLGGQSSSTSTGATNQSGFNLGLG